MTAKRSRLGGMMVIGTLVLTGCRVNETTGVPEVNTQAFDGDNWRKQYASELQRRYAKFPDEVKRYDTAATLDRKEARNAIVSDLMWLIDYDYGQSTKRIYYRDGGIQFGGDILTLALTTAATISGGEQAKTVLSAIATLVTGGKAAYNAEFLKDKAVTGIIARMDALRADQKNLMVPRLHDEDIVTYPLRDALQDVLAYYEAGTMVKAIVEMEKEATKAKETAEKSLTLTQQRFQQPVK